jgi:hypothetical protein
MLSHIDSAAKMVLQHQQWNMQIVQRWKQPSQPLHLCHFSGISRTSRQHKMTIQRLAPSQPPAISAGNMQNVQFVQ